MRPPGRLLTSVMRACSSSISLVQPITVASTAASRAIRVGFICVWVSAASAFLLALAGLFLRGRRCLDLLLLLLVEVAVGLGGHVEHEIRGQSAARAATLARRRDLDV